MLGDEHELATRAVRRLAHVTDEVTLAARLDSQPFAALPMSGWRAARLAVMIRLAQADRRMQGYGTYLN